MQPASLSPPETGPTPLEESTGPHRRLQLISSGLAATMYSSNTSDPSWRLTALAVSPALGRAQMPALRSPEAFEGSPWVAGPAS